MKVTEEKLYELASGEKQARGDSATTAFGVSGTKVLTAYRVATAGKHEAVIVNGKRGPDVDDVRWLAVDESRRHVLYSAKIDKKEHVFVDGEQSDPFVTIDEPTHSPDGARFGYFASPKKKEWVAIVDGKPGPSFSGLRALTFSPDGKHVAYLANEGGTVDKYLQIDGGRWSVILDGKRVEADKHHISWPTFARDGRLAYSVGDGDDGPQRVIADGKAHEDFRFVSKLAYSATGTLGYVGTTGDESFAVIAGKRVLPAAEVRDLTWSPDGTRYFFSDGKRVVVDGKELSGLGQLTYPVWSPDGKRISVNAVANKKRHIVVDGKRGPELDDERDLRVFWSANSAHYAYLGTVGEQLRAFVDGEPIGGSYKNTFELALSPDGSRVAFSALDGDRCVWVVDGKPESVAFEIGVVGAELAWTRDGKHYAHPGGKKEKVRLVVDGAEVSDPVSRIFHIAALEDGSFVALAQRKGAPLLLRAR